ncbi:MAG: hypothetical protein AB8B96_08590 [Lysobacterales bacterium]
MRRKTVPAPASGIGIALLAAMSMNSAWASCFLVDTVALTTVPAICASVPDPDPDPNPGPDPDPGPGPDPDPDPDPGPLPPAAGDYETYNPSINPNQMVFDGERWSITVATDGTVWWNDQTGEAERYTVPIFPGDTAEIPGVFAANPDGSPLTPTNWAYTFGAAFVMQDSDNWEMAAVGNRPDNGPIKVTVEHKRTIGASSAQGDVGDIGIALADIRVTVNADGTLFWEYRTQGSYQPLDPISYASRINCSGGCDVMIGAYAYGTKGLPFVGGAEGVIVN